MVKVGVNGFGRIGRLVVKAALKNKNIDVVAVNDLMDAKSMAHLFKYDSTFGVYPEDVKVAGDSIVIGSKKIKVTSEKDPAQLPWKAMGVEVVVESTGIFRDKEKASKHITAGAKKVIISAPAKNEDLTIVLGVNEDKYDPKSHNILSNASCTTNCLAPMVKVLRDTFGMKGGLMTTIHSYTNDQVILDFPHKDLRRARSGAVNMIPTSTGAAKAIGLVIPELNGKLNGLSIRVPTPDVSVVDLVAELEKETTVDEVNAAMKKASQGALGKYLGYTDEPLVSHDFVGNPKSCIFDAGGTYMVNGNQVKVLGWYDNEWGYSSRVIDLIDYVVGKGL